MRILFVSWRHESLVGGVQVTTHHLATELIRRGHEVAVLGAKLSRRGRVTGLAQKLARRAGPRSDTALGYPVFRSPDPGPAVTHLLAAFGPDVVVVNGYAAWSRPWARAVLEASRGVPSVLYLRDFGCTDLPANPSLGIDGVIAVSRAVGAETESHGVAVTYINPMVLRERYDVPTSRRVALFINPVPDKGVEVAMALARSRPDIPFAFVRCWPIGPRTLWMLRRRAARYGNVEVRPSVREPAQLYGDARVLLVPSVYPEPWGRVGSEALMSGIPVVASAGGGLPECVGDGGIVVAPDAGLDGWVEALSSLWDDETTYERHVALAEARGRVIDRVSSSAAERVEAFLRDVAGKRG